MPSYTRAIQSVTSSMARLGGGGRGYVIFEPMLAEGRKQTGLLRKIAENTKKPAERSSAMTAAVYAHERGAYKHIAELERGVDV